ncbi:MAG: hypothetical protein ACKODL_10270 [Phenylobacterium sp.]
MKLLIFGDGVSGLTLRAPPQQRVLNPVVAERERVCGDFRPEIWVWPLGLRRFWRRLLNEMESPI